VGEFTMESTNGVHRTVWHLAKHQAALGHEITVLFYGRHPSEDEQRQADAAGVNIVGVPLTRWRPFAFPRHVSKLIYDARPILHFHSAFIPCNTTLSRLARSRDVPYVSTPHSAYNGNALRRGWLKKRLFFRLWERTYLFGASAVHAVGESEVPALQRLGYQGKIALIPNGVDVVDPLPQADGGQRAAIGCPQESLLFLFLGRFDSRQKGLDLLLQAFRAATGELGKPPGILAMAGGGHRSDGRRLRLLVRSLGLDESVRLLGPVFGEEKRNLMSSCNVFVHTSRWEGLPFACLEALALARPLLVTEATNLGRHVRSSSCGMAVPTEDIRAITGAIIKLAMETPEKLAAMGMRGREYARRAFSWHRIAQNMVELYSEVLAHHAEGQFGRSGSEPRPPPRDVEKIHDWTGLRSGRYAALRT
jgi:glycosyltransferase involved in cell wall biosynthesis